MTLPQNPSRKTVILNAAILVILVAGYLVWHCLQGWIAHDEGLLGHTAERTMQGEIPHVEFQDVYTGLLSQIHAVSFRWLGVNLVSLRIPLLIGATATSLIWFFIALRFLSPSMATLTAASATFWSFPNYFAALPSWYILMTSSGTVWALIKFQETNSRRYILIASLLCGVAILFKIVGLYLVAASLFAIWISRNPIVQRDSDYNQSTSRNPHLSMSIGLAGIFTLIVVWLIRQHFSVSTACYFIIPVAAAMGTIIEISRRSQLSLKDSVVDCLIFCISLTLPLLAFAIPYVFRGQLDHLIHGIFELPRARFDHAAALPPSGLWCLAAVPFIMLTIVERRIPKSMIVPLTATIALVGALLCAMANNILIYQFAFVGVQCSLPAIAVAVWFCGRTQDIPKPLGILLLVTACIALTQYPYSSGVYFCYCAPLVGLTFTGLIARNITYEKPIWVTLILMLTVFAALNLNYSNPRRIGLRFQQIDNTERLKTIRSGLKIEMASQLEYDQLLQLINSHTTSDEFILAGPDCPQFYFLSNRKNPTPQCYDLFRAYQLRDQKVLEQELKTILEDYDIRIFIHNRRPEFSQPYSQEFISWMESWGQRMPAIGSGRFEIFIRERG